MADEKIMEMIDEIERALISRDAIRMRELSNEASNLAVLSQDKDVIELAVASYALNKILSKIHFQEEVEQLYREVKPDFDADYIGAVLDKIREFDLKHGLFQGDIVEKARIKIGSRLYSRGLSMTHSANLVGATGNDILAFAGKTKVHEETDTKPINQRLEVTRKLFR
ncbi:hypothetical protein ACFLRC_02890 [Candidatus Altiarchaeota archaeon]